MTSHILSMKHPNSSKACSGVMFPSEISFLNMGYMYWSILPRDVEHWFASMENSDSMVHTSCSASQNVSGGLAGTFALTSEIFRSSALRLGSVSA